jgi:hypothetical protein
MEMPPVARIVASNGLSNHRPSKVLGITSVTTVNSTIVPVRRVAFGTIIIPSVLWVVVALPIYSLHTDLYLCHTLINSTYGNLQ